MDKECVRKRGSVCVGVDNGYGRCGWRMGERVGEGRGERESRHLTGSESMMVSSGLYLIYLNQILIKFNFNFTTYIKFNEE